MHRAPQVAVDICGAKSQQQMVAADQSNCPCVLTGLIRLYTSQGTIVEWTAAVGQTVKADDVVALIETDKVTVDIKAEVDGVIVQHFGEV